MGRYPENTGIKDLILLGRTSESTPRFLREGNETCERLRTVPPGELAHRGGLSGGFHRAKPASRIFLKSGCAGLMAEKGKRRPPGAE